MTYLTLSEINSNEKYAPIGYEIEFKSRIQKDKVVKEIIFFFNNPFLLSPKYVKGYGTAGGGKKFKMKNKDISYGFKSGDNLSKEFFEDKEGELIIDDNIKKEALDHLKIKSKETKFWIFNDKRELKFIPSAKICYDCKSYVNKDKVETEYHFSLEGKFKVPKFTFVKDFLTIDKVNYNSESPLNKVVNCFNIIEKEFKIMNETTRDYYKRYFTKKPFFQFEEIGLEILYARKGYAIDGKRLPSFNRGSVWSLKRSLKQNNIKQKGLTRKDDIIKALMKL